jgi:hypothetical protein
LGPCNVYSQKLIILPYIRCEIICFSHSLDSGECCKRELGLDLHYFGHFPSGRAPPDVSKRKRSDALPNYRTKFTHWSHWLISHKPLAAGSVSKMRFRVRSPSQTPQIEVKGFG